MVEHAWPGTPPVTKPILLVVCSSDPRPDFLSEERLVCDFDVVEAQDLHEADLLAQRLHPDLLLITSTGWNPASRSPDRHFGRLPVILLSAKSRSMGTDLHGIDDLVPPDANGEEAAIWIRAVLRRKRPTSLTNRMRQGSLEVDHILRQVTDAGRPVPVTFAEFNLLALMMEMPGRVWSYPELARALWGVGYRFKDESSRRFVQTLRRKIVAVAGQSTIITVEDRGYRFDL